MRCIERHIAAGFEHDGAVGRGQQGLAAHHNVAANELAAQNGVFQAAAAPGHVHTGIELDVAVGGQRAACNGQRLPHVDQNAAVAGALACQTRRDDAVDIGHRCQQVNQLVGHDDGVVRVGR